MRTSVGPPQCSDSSRHRDRRKFSATEAKVMVALPKVKDISADHLSLLSFNGAAESTEEPVVRVLDAIG